MSQLNIQLQRTVIDRFEEFHKEPCKANVDGNGNGEPDVGAVVGDQVNFKQRTYFPKLDYKKSLV